MLTQEILRARPHTANVFHHSDSSRIIGAVLYDKPSLGLPAIPLPRSPRTLLGPRSHARSPVGELDLFARTGP